MNIIKPCPYCHAQIQIHISLQNQSLLCPYCHNFINVTQVTPQTSAVDPFDFTKSAPENRTNNTISGSSRRHKTTPKIRSNKFVMLSCLIIGTVAIVILLLFLSGHGKKVTAIFIPPSSSNSDRNDDSTMKELVGMWQYRKGDLAYELDIMRDGAFVLYVKRGEDSFSIRGSWAVQNDEFILNPTHTGPKNNESKMPPGVATKYKINSLSKKFFSTTHLSSNLYGEQGTVDTVWVRVK